MAFSFALLRSSALSSVPPLKSFLSREFSVKRKILKVRRTCLNRINWYREHEYLPPNPQIQSWVTPSDPVEARRRMRCLSIQYHQQMKELRKKWHFELKLEELVKSRNKADHAKVVRAIFKKQKDRNLAPKKAKAAENIKREEEFQKVLKLQRQKRLEYWRVCQEVKKEVEKDKMEELRRQSAYWVDEHELEERILKALANVTPL